MKLSKNALLLTLAVVVGSSFIGCSNNKSQTGSEVSDKALFAMNEILKQFPDKKGYHKVLQHWNFKMPSGELFEWSKDTSANKADYAIVLMSDDFVKAGLDLEKMDKEKWLIKPAEVEDGKQLPNRLIRPYNISDKSETSDGSEDALRRLFKQKPDIVKYDSASESFRLNFDDGIEVRWAQKPGKGDFDLEFVFNVEPFTKAGLDLSKIQESGWLFDGEKKNDTSSSVAVSRNIVKKFKLK